MTLITQVLEVAKSQVGTREVGPNNYGPRVKEYLAATGLPQGNPWCAAFIAFCMKKAGVPRWLHSADTWALRDWARDLRILHDSPQRGDVFLLIDRNGDPSHTGFVHTVTGDRIGTFEGNTGGPSDTDGDGVYSKSRSAASSLYIRWADLAENQPKVRVTVQRNGRWVGVDCSPLVEDGATRVDLRPLCDALGLVVDFDPESRSIAVYPKGIG